MDNNGLVNSVSTAQDATNNWSLPEKILFRFIFLLFMLFIVFFNNGAFPLFSLVIHYPTVLLNKLLIWISDNILHLGYELVTQPNGSGDTSYNYVLLLFILIISFLGCIIWSVLDSKQLNYQKLYYWLTLAVRLYLGLMLINYGMVKVIKLQFPFPSLNRLSSTYGESSPMGLAWTFLGFSTGYNLFMGIAELMSMLLLFRRTVALGAIIALMTTANVMAVNYFYDVPVKILSTALFLMSLYLLVPNRKRLFNFFIYGEAVKLRTIDPPAFSKQWIPKSIPVIKILLIFAPILFAFLMLITQHGRYSSAKKLPLYGIYKVSLFNWQKDTTQNSVYALEWSNLIIETEGRCSIRFRDGTRDFCDLNIDTVKRQILLTFKDDVKAIHKFSYSKPDTVYGQENFSLNGTLFGNPVIIKLRKQKLPLVETGFNWINEFPNNR